jgi:hypothetical protein
MPHLSAQRAWKILASFILIIEAVSQDYEIDDEKEFSSSIMANKSWSRSPEGASDSSENDAVASEK